MKQIITLISLAVILLFVGLLTAALASAHTTENDTLFRVGETASVPLQAADGPDGFGYTYQDDLEADGPTFSWIEISGTGPITGTPLGITLDDGTAVITPTAGFDFNFYGTPLSNLNVAKNGVILFNDTVTKKVEDNLCLSAGNNVIAPWWDDWSGGEIYWVIQGTAPNRQLIVQWDGMIHFDAGPPDTATFEVILFETSDVILFQYLDGNVTGTIYDYGQDGTVGIQASSFLEYGCNTANLADSRAIRFQRSSLTIEKVTDPAGGTGFDFTTTGPISPTFTLDDGQSQLFYTTPGTYTITESLPAGWDLTDITCVNDLTGTHTTDLGAATATINLAPGENTTCTFTNESGSITIVKDAIPDDTQVFTFTTTGLISPTFTLDDDGTPGNPLSNTITFSGLTSGTYTVTEEAVTDWDVTNIYCEGGGFTSTADTATISLDAGEDIICTFSNTKRGSILINKATDPSPDGTLFNFTTTGLISPTFSLADGESQLFSSVVPDSYPVTEEDPGSEWDLTDLTCSDPDNGSSTSTSTRKATIDLDPGEFISCTFTNTKRGSITIVKDAIPDHPQDFNFTGGLGPFTLDDDPGDGTRSNTESRSNLEPGSYVVTEILPFGWDLTNIACNDPSGGTITDTVTGQATIDLDPGENITCTFTNEPQPGSITIVKDADPDHTQVFTFTGTLGTFPLDDDGTAIPLTNTITFPGLTFGSYTVTEDAIFGWDLTDLTCNDPDNGSTTSKTTRTATIDLDPGEDITCTFTNTKRGSITIIKDTQPDGETQDFDFGGDLGSFTLDDDPGSVLPPNFHTNLNLLPGDYTVTEDVTNLTALGWGLADITCTGDLDNGTVTNTSTGQATIDVDAGEDITCTFTNARLGSIEIIKDAVPDHPQDFDFTTSGGPIPPTFTLDDEPADGTWPNTTTFSDLLPGSYVVTETLPFGWDLTDITCNDPSGGTITDTVTGQATIDLASGETVSCTFINEPQPGTIEISKDAIPDDPQDFTFTTTSLISPTFTLDDDETLGSPSPLPNTITFSDQFGSYTITETVPSGWDLTGLTCSDPDGGTSVDLGTGTATIDLDPGEFVTCDFANTKRGSITVVKDAIPDDTQVFTFTGSGGIGSFTLDDDGPSGSALTNTITFSDLTPDISYAVTEDPITGWDLTNINCVGGDFTSTADTATVSLDPGENVTCTFTNTSRGRIIIDKVTEPSPDESSTFFDFTTSGGLTPSAFALRDDDPSQEFLVEPGSYVVTETVTSGWDLTDIACDDPSGGTITDTVAGQATIDLVSRETVTCTFTNRAQASQITIIKDARPDSSQVFSFIPDFNSLFFLDDNGIQNDPFSNTITFSGLAPDTYFVAETATGGWNLTDIVCNDPSGGTVPDPNSGTASIALAAGETVACTFTNVEAGLGSITIVKSAVPTSTQPFTFTSDFGTFFLVDDGTATNDSFTQLLGAGTYVVSETSVLSWNLTSIDCGGDRNTTIDLGTRTATIGLDPDENLICTFTNSMGTSVDNTVYLPIILKGGGICPDVDLQITSLTVSSGKVTVIVENTGPCPTDDGFWVDLYGNIQGQTPDQLVGDTADRRWNSSSVNAEYGLAWAVSVLDAGDSITLTSDGSQGPKPVDKKWPPPPGTTILAYADSFDKDDPNNETFVEIPETNEDNNQSNSVIIATAPGVEPSNLPTPSQFPPRPDLD